MSSPATDATTQTQITAERLANLEKKLEALVAYMQHLEVERDKAVKDSAQAREQISAMEQQQQLTCKQLTGLLEQLKELEVQKND